MPPNDDLRDQPPVAPRRRRGVFVRFVVMPVLALVIASVAVVAALRFVPPPTTAFMLAHALGGGSTQQRWVPFGSISSHMAIAVVAAEDQKFPQHRGFDIDSIEDALDARERGGRVRGASTISQQVAKNLFLWSGRSWVRKGLEAYFTVLIEALWTKRRIMEVYLNVAELGPGVYGVEAASKRHFGKSAGSLSAHEAALLAAVLPNPKVLTAAHPSAYVLDRVRWIRRQVGQLGGADYLGFAR